ncbi:MAG: osmoprotectant transport system substrate-binding protein [Chloroflexota bacterium]|jgi:osmoprotectant transport system substrate-binding protein|nr:osmoprotectant transport system substrate-binding protein [Chloroflexota bacterium]
MRTSRRLALGAIVLALLVGACSTGGGSKPTIKIGSVGFDEARVMAEIYAQALEANGYTVDRAGIGLGPRPVVAPAIESGQIDLQPEYIGSRLTHEGGTSGPDSAANASALQEKLTPKHLTLLNYAPAIDTNAFVVRAETAQEFNLTKVSDLAAVQDELLWGLPTDCPTNALCGAPGGALQSDYGITADTIAAATLLTACDVPMSDALKNGTIDVAELCSTSPEILVYGWVVLEDDMNTQPADNVAPIVRDDYLAKLSDKDAFKKILDDVSAQVDTATLADLYKQVSVDHKDLADVARTWLQAHGFAPTAS